MKYVLLLLLSTILVGSIPRFGIAAGREAPVACPAAGCFFMLVYPEAEAFCVRADLPRGKDGFLHSKWKSLGDYELASRFNMEPCSEARFFPVDEHHVESLSLALSALKKAFDGHASFDTSRLDAPDARCLVDGEGVLAVAGDYLESRGRYAGVATITVAGCGRRVDAGVPLVGAATAGSIRLSYNHGLTNLDQ